MPNIPEKMRAVRFDATTRKLEVTEVPVPQLEPHEVLVKVLACGICLSDVHLIDGSIPPVKDVVTLGHEASGEIVATGSEVPGWSPGQRVVMAGGKPCGTCDRCRMGMLEDCRNFMIMGFHYDGAWADYVAVPFFACAPIPDDMPVEQAAILADAVATPFAALVERASLKPAENVGLWGIGGLGTHAVQIARMVGAGLIVAVDPLESARKRALDVGADVALDPTSSDVRKEISKLTGGMMLDVAVDLVGANAVISQCVGCLGRGGRAVMVGLSLEPLQLEPSILFGIQSHAVLGHLGYNKGHLEQLVRLLANGRLQLEASISDVMPLEDTPKGVERLANKDGDPVRLVVKP
jgi:D-arabinose 1-dehydrogenase-like Zn-dependent alcohol dehydrogenase